MLPQRQDMARHGFLMWSNSAVAQAVGADDPVTITYLVFLVGRGVVTLGIWLRTGLTLRHCQYSCHYGWHIWWCSACSAGLPCSPGLTAPGTPSSWTSGLTRMATAASRHSNVV